MVRYNRPLGHEAFNVFAGGSRVLQDGRIVYLSDPGTTSVGNYALYSRGKVRAVMTNL